MIQYAPPCDGWGVFTTTRRCDVPIISLDISGTAKLDRASGCFSTVQIDGDVNLSDHDLAELVDSIGTDRILASIATDVDSVAFAREVSRGSAQWQVADLLTHMIEVSRMQADQIAEVVANVEGMTVERIAAVMAHLYEASRDE